MEPGSADMAPGGIVRTDAAVVALEELEARALVLPSGHLPHG